MLWRAFVYDTTVDADRAKCAFAEFAALDGRFETNVIVQVKNGPVDFQPREPFDPLFGAMPRTPVALELRITQEYLGHSTHFVYLGGMWNEVLTADTFARGQGSTVAHMVDGSLFGLGSSCIVGVANTGSDRNWCGHHFGQANWYAFGRLATEPDRTPRPCSRRRRSPIRATLATGSCCTAMYPIPPTCRLAARSRGAASTRSTGVTSRRRRWRSCAPDTGSVAIAPTS